MKCVCFNIQDSGTSKWVKTDLYLALDKNTVTLQWCSFGGIIIKDEQKSVIAQNQVLPPLFRPNCEQCFFVPGIDLDAEEDESRIFKLCITPCGKITFIIRRSDADAEVKYPVFDGSSVTWISFHNC